MSDCLEEQNPLMSGPRSKSEAGRLSPVISNQAASLRGSTYSPEHLSRVFLKAPGLSWNIYVPNYSRAHLRDQQDRGFLFLATKADGQRWGTGL